MPDHKSKHHKHKKDKKKKRHRDEPESGGSKKRSKGESGAGITITVQLTEDDYFTRQPEFAYWLRKKQEIFADQLTAEDARKFFAKFCKKWNRGELSEKYYEAGTKADTGAQTGFKWKFATKLKGADQKRLDALKGYVGQAKNADVLKGNGEALELESVVARAPAPSSMAVADAGRGGSGAKKRVLGPSMPPPGELAHSQRQADRKDAKDYRKHKEMVVDELSGGKATGHDAKQEKRRLGQFERTQREASPDAAGVAADAYGAGNSFAAAVAKRNEKSERRHGNRQGKYDHRKELAQSKVSAHQESEAAKIAALKALMASSRSSNALYQPKP